MAEETQQRWWSGSGGVPAGTGGAAATVRGQAGGCTEGGRGVGSGDWTRHAHEEGAQAEPRPAGCRRLRAPAPCRRARVRGRCRAPPVRWPPARASPPRRGGASHWGCRNGGHRLDARARPPAAPLPAPACRARAGRRPPMPRGPSAAPSRGRVEEGAAYARSPRPPAIGGSPGTAAAPPVPLLTCQRRADTRASPHTPSTLAPEPLPRVRSMQADPRRRDSPLRGRRYRAPAMNPALAGGGCQPAAAARGEVGSPNGHAHHPARVGCRAATDTRGQASAVRTSTSWTGMEEADRVPPAPGRRRGGARGRRQPSGRWRAQPAGARPRGSVPPLPPAPTSAPQTLGRQPAAFARVWRARADTPGSATGGCQRTTAISAATAAPLPGRDQREGQMKRGEPTAAAAATPPRATCWEPPLPAKKGYKKRGDRARRVAVRAPRPSCSTCTYTTLCTGGEKRDTRWDAYATKDKNTQEKQP